MHTVAISCSSVAHGFAEVNASLALMERSSSHRGSQDLLPSPRHIPIGGDHPMEAASDPVNDGDIKIKTLLLEMKALQVQIENIQSTSQEAQTEEPLAKRFKLVLDDHRTHLMEIKALMQQQEITHNHQMSQLKDTMKKAQEDIMYLLDKTRALAEGVDPADQPCRSMDRAASGQRLNMLSGKMNPYVDPRGVQPGQPSKPFLLRSNTGEVQPAPHQGNARNRMQRSRPPPDQDQNTGSSSGAKSLMEVKEDEEQDQLALANPDLGRSSSAFNKLKVASQEEMVDKTDEAQRPLHRSLAQVQSLQPEETEAIRAEFKDARVKATQEEKERAADLPNADLPNPQDDERLSKGDWEAHFADKRSSNRGDEASSSEDPARASRRSSSQCSQRSTASNMSQRERSEREVRQRSQDQFQPMVHRPHLVESKLKLDQIEFEGNLVTDIEYGDLGNFYPLKFNTEADLMKSLRFLDLTGSMSAPPFKTVLRLAITQVRGHKVQGNPCLLLNFVPHQGMQEEDVVHALATLGGALAFPNSNVVGIVVSYKFNIALVHEEDDKAYDTSLTTREFPSMDGQVFMGFQSVQLAEAYKEYFNSHLIKFRSYDEITSSNQFYFHAKITAVTSKQPMADLKTSLQPGKMRQGVDVFVCPKPDQLDPQWRQNQQGQWEWRSRYVRREDWNGPEFYRSSVLFQKHSNREARILDLATGRNTVPQSSTLDSITPLSFPGFVGTPKFKSEHYWHDRRASPRG